ncbi:ABC transporter ATP-binding protein [Amygdalobacter nucleatus]|uniref:ABC transporter, ATP-binding protein n=2 Tax=Amygdalobacter nucleatus TaxID=3029274 RepID=A0A133YDA4_9FIRM|nr:ABC transporter ATP-binding protein [Amygdalobacter nucleatus]KXB41133.1 ABC transporter, ATP-binding protein [Amygdalobacter nucleatus]MDF0485119.1 ABC transporter ATP-binding protein [Amygdalobacter nucleatus]MDF0486464.1 ABC transporter ATP-binding protein [Amygdalobacter nucleatus]MDF0486481.1 ABC transporter ATP-binding protein [Amygdalobacter nucleatus]MDF0486494.1 ABC transporter ATP-binding protein [Amygdalobacter nucleatus]
MLKMLKKFFDFCNTENRNKFYKALALGVLDAVFTAMKIPAAFFTVTAVLNRDIGTKEILVVIGLMLISTVGKMIINRYSQMMQTEAGYNTAAGKRIEIGEHLRYLPMGYFNDTSLGHITSVTTNSMEQLGDIATRAVMMILQGSITTVIIGIGLFAFDVRIAVIGLIGIVVFCVVNIFTNRNVARVAEEKLQADKDMVGVVLEYIQGIAEIRNYNLVSANNSRLEKAIDRKRKADISAETAAIPMVGLQQLVCKLTGVVIAGASVYFCINGTMALNYTITMLLCSFILFEMLDLAGVYTALLRVIGRCVDLANEILSVQQMDINGEDIKPENHDIHLDHVSFAYENRKIIDDLTLDIKEKTTTAIVGPSGGGKTTVTSLIARFWDVQDGKVTLGGKDVKDYSFDSLMENFSFVFQRVYLFEDTIANNIRFGRPDAPMKDVIEAAKKASAHDFIMGLPDGYETMIGEGGATLSGGEKQRIAIARAIMKDAPIIILDEATANVDPENEKELTQAIENLTREKTIIMIAHRLKTVRHADQIIVIDKGRIVQQGTHESLIREDGIYRNFVSGRRSAVSWKIA